MSNRRPRRIASGLQRRRTDGDRDRQTHDERRQQPGRVSTELPNVRHQPYSAPVCDCAAEPRPPAHCKRTATRERRSIPLLWVALRTAEPTFVALRLRANVLQLGLAEPDLSLASTTHRAEDSVLELGLAVRLRTGLD